MVYTSVFAGLAAAFCWGTADYMSRSQSERLGYFRTVMYSHLTTLVVLLAVFPFLSPVPVFTPLPIFALVVAGALNFVAFVFLYRAFHTGVVSVVAPIAYTYPAVTTVLSIAILGALLSSSQLFAIAGIIVGVVLLSTRFSEIRLSFGSGSRPNLTRGVGSAIGSSVFFGTVYIGVGYAAPAVSYAFPAVVLRGVALAIGLGVAPLIHQSIRPFRASLSKTLAMMGILEAAGFLSFTYGVYSAGGSSLPIVAALSGMGGAVAASYGMAFLKERLEPNQIVGVVLSILGVFTLLYLGG